MKKTYMTVGQKERVRNRLLDRKFKPLREADELARSDLAQRVLVSQLTEKEWAKIGELPAGWLPRTASIKLADPTERYTTHSINLPGSEAVPSSLYSTTFDQKTMSPELWAEWEALEPRSEQLKAERRDLQRQIDATLGTFRTVEAARDGWPEAADIITEVCGKGSPKTLPAVTTLNAALDLPPEEKEAT